MRHRVTVVALGAAVVPLFPGLPCAVALAEEDGLQHNITYRARVDGLARGALISYRISDAQVSTVDPTMLPGRTFEATAVLSDAAEAGMRISIQWPYSANLVCEILVDEQTVAAASQFISPRLTPARDDPDYGALNCGAPLSNATGIPISEAGLPPDAVATPDPAVDPAAPVDPAVPAQPEVPPPGTAVDPAAPPLN